MSKTKTTIANEGETEAIESQKKTEESVSQEVYQTEVFDMAKEAVIGVKKYLDKYPQESKEVESLIISLYGKKTMTESQWSETVQTLLTRTTT